MPSREELSKSREILTAAAQRVRVDASSPNPDILLSAARIIRQGGIVAYPTETFYGLGADPFSEAAIDRLRRVKNAPAGRPFILIVSRAEKAHDFCDLSGSSRIWFGLLARAFWPGPLTLVLPSSRPGMECPAAGGARSLAVRVSSHPLALQLCRSAGGAITSTSANRAGDTPPRSAEAIDAGLAGQIDLTLDAGASGGDRPSTILDISGPRPGVIRQGVVSVEAIAAALGFTPQVTSNQEISNHVSNLP